MGTFNAVIQRSTALLVAVVVALTALASGPAPSVEAAAPLSVRAWLGNNCISGLSARNARVKIVWKSADWSLKRKGIVRSRKSGKWTICSKNGSFVVAKDRIFVKVGSRSRRVRVPAITATIDRFSDRVTGKSMPGRTVIVEVCGWRAPGPRWICSWRQPVAAGDGAYRAQFGSRESIVGGDRVSVFVPKNRYPKGDLYGREQQAPYVRVELGSAGLSGAYTPGHAVAVELWDKTLPTVKMKGDWTGSANRSVRRYSKPYRGKMRTTGLFSGAFADDAGRAVKVAPGDRVVVSGSSGDDFWFFPADVVLSARPATDVVTGDCGSGQVIYELLVKSPSGSKRATYRSTTDAEGRFTKDTTKRINLLRGYQVLLTCHEPSGDQVASHIVAT